ncbi:hypothetical protein NQ315_017094 [Exocentrus adspersus]|uniref:General transcription factor IIE subunit 1 n=1 Tax=Exocentrus adspersus TaxID=1586481 RepID=A0AAV8VH74_9CUCU|nr:hypothetical protein NQ315_017094 [Exocentrus adspersus]
MTEEKLVTEVPSSLKQLARLVVRGFYSIEDALIVDMLVRNPCMKEDDMCELLKFERKMLRARIATLKNDKFIQVRLRMETGGDGKAQKVNYYFINYKTFVNVIKYKLDIMRKRLETEERDATSRASFKCLNCLKTFTDLEADQLFDFATSEFRCTFCREVVEEDSSALPKKDSRLLLAKFNEQLEPLYILLREVEVRLEGWIKKANAPLSGQEWSGEATRKAGFLVEESRVDVTIGEESNAVVNRKEQPIWMTESTVVSNMDSQDANKPSDGLLENAQDAAGASAAAKTDDIMSVLLAHEKRPTDAAANAVKGLTNESDSSSDEMNEVKTTNEDVEMMESDEDEDDHVPTVTVGTRTYPITDINDTIIAEMTQAEKEIYVQVFQDYYSHMNY